MNASPIARPPHYPPAVSFPEPASLPPTGWQSGYAEHVLHVDLPDMPTRLLQVTIRVDGPYAEFRLLLDGMLLAQRALTPEQVGSADAASYRADALAWAADGIDQHLRRPLQVAANLAWQDERALALLHAPPATELALATMPDSQLKTKYKKPLLRTSKARKTRKTRKATKKGRR